MKTALMTLVAAAALGAFAGCERNPEASKAPPPAGTGATSAPQPTTNTPANVGPPSQAEKREGANPTQQQVDPKQPEQHRDFQQKGDAAGPKPGG